MCASWTERNRQRLAKNGRHILRRKGVPSRMRAIWLVVSAMLAYGQAGMPRPVFEVASIKPSPPPDPMGYRVGTSGGPGTPDPGRWSAQNYSLKNLIYTAYNLKSYELAAPDWTNSERFDIVAKVPEGAS